MHTDERVKIEETLLRILKTVTSDDYGCAVYNMHILGLGFHYFQYFAAFKLTNEYLAFSSLSAASFC